MLKRLDQVGKMGGVIRSATQEAFSQVGSGIVQTGFEGKMPTAETIAAQAVSMVGAVAGAGVGGGLKHGVDPLSSAQSARHYMAASIAQSVVTTTGQVGGEVAGNAGLGKMTGGEFLGHVSERGFFAVQQGFMQGLQDIGAQGVKAAGEHADEQAQKRKAEDEAKKQQDGDDSPKTMGKDDPPPKHDKEPDTVRDASWSPHSSKTLADPEPGVPEGLVEIGLDAKEANRSFAASLAIEKTKEAAVFVDLDNGEHVCVQGSKTMVEEGWKGSDPSLTNRRWKLLYHFHPDAPDVARYPSPSDFKHITAMQRRGETPVGPVESTLVYRDAKGQLTLTYFGYEPGKGYWIRYVDDAGHQQVEIFKTPPWENGSEYKTDFIRRRA